ncbi:zinc-dependent alcohol dehydrogenase [Spirillospora sp. CA-255316]
MHAQAAVTVGDRDIRMQTLPVPDRPPRGGAILRVTANGLCGSDYDLYTGHLRKSSPTLAPLPLVSGHEMVGVLELVDEQAAEQWDARPGDRVAVDPGIRCGQCTECAGQTGDRCRAERRYSTIPLSTGTGLWGGNAQYMVLLPGTFMVKIPPHLNDEDATLFNPLANAIHWTTKAAHVRPGDRVLILGAGQRAFTCAAVAHRAGARQIIVTGLARDQHKAALLTRFGADELIDATSRDIVPHVRELTDGQGVDVVIDTVPGTTLPTKDGLASLRQGGRLVAAGIKAMALDGLDLNTVITREHQIRGVFGSSSTSTQQAVQMLAAGDYPFSRLHSHRFGLDDLDRALRILGGEVADENPLHLTMLPWGA